MSLLRHEPRTERDRTRHVSCILPQARAVPGLFGPESVPFGRIETRGYIIVSRSLPRLLAAAILLFGAEVTLGQTATLDEGAFVIDVNGRQIGTETFRIRRSGQGDAAVVIAQATLKLNSGDIESVTTLLQALGRDMTLTGYQVRVSTDEVTRLTQAGQRLEAVTTSSTGQREREYRGGPQAVVLEEHMAHHYFFLGHRAGPAPSSLSVIVPRSGEQARGTLVQGGVEQVQVAGTQVSAQRLTLDVGGTVHVIWVDQQNRVLRVEIAATNYIAVRRELP